MGPQSIADIRGGARDLFRATVGIVYPTLCFGCEVRVPDDQEGALPVCPACLRTLPRASAKDVNKRLALLPEASGIFSQVFALWVFDDSGTIRRLQHALKYRNQPHLGQHIGRFMGEALASIGSHDHDFILPVPLARRRQLERGYNQSQRLAFGIAEGFGNGSPIREDVLYRTRSTHSQTNLSRSNRWKNVSGAFGLSGASEMMGQRVLLVDDILTTGATLTAAAQPLREAGAIVDLAVFAVVAV